MKLSLCFVLIAILATCVVHVESNPILGHIKRGYEKTVDGLHSLGCKIVSHRGCEDDSEEEYHVHNAHCGHHHNHGDHYGFYDINTDSDISNDVKTTSTSSTTLKDDVTPEAEIDIRFGEQDATTEAEGRNVVTVNSCSAGYRRDRSGKCRQIV